MTLAPVVTSVSSAESYAALGAGDAFDVQGVAMLWWWRSPTKVMYQWQQR